MISKVNTISWFLSRPQYSGQIWHLMATRINWKKENSAVDASKWAESLCVSDREAMARLCPEHQWVEPDKEHPIEYSVARRAQNACPVTMGGPGELGLLFNVVRAFGTRSAMETGVAYGWSSFTILMAGKSNGLRLASTDMPYPRLDNDDFVGCVVPETLRPRWKLIRERDRRGIGMAASWLRKPPTLIHHDSDKSYRGRKWAFPVLWDNLGPDGVLICNNIGNNIAFREFCDKLGQTPIIIGDGTGYAGILRKGR